MILRLETLNSVIIEKAMVLKLARVIRDKCLRLKDEDEPQTDCHERMIIQAALRISNELYGTDVCSTQELAKGYTRPVTNGSFPVKVPNDIAEAH